MTTPIGILFSDPQVKPLSTVGQPQAGAYLNFYLTGTLTPANVYADGGLTTPLNQPVTADSAGRFVPIYLNPVTFYRVQLYNAGGSKLEDTDPYVVPGMGSQVNILAYGADPSGTFDSTAAFQVAGATGKLIYCPAGTYLVSSGITITGGGLYGDGAYQTTIVTTDTASNNVFNYTGALAGTFRDIQFGIQTTKTGGYAVVVGPASGEVSAMRFLQCVFNGFPNCINFVAASLWSVVACNFYGYKGDAITVNNTNNADSGDSTIEACVFTSPGNTNCNGVHQLESGGLRVVGNKFNDNGVHFLLDLGLHSTSDLLIVGNSFENAYFSAVQLQRTSGAATFGNVVITGNQFLMSSASGNSSGVYSNNGSAFLSDITVNGNSFAMVDEGNANCVILDYVTNGLISGNVMGGNGSGTNTCGTLLGTHNTNVNIGMNTCSGLTNSANYPSGTNVLPSVQQTGTGTVTTSTGLGSLYEGTLTITFSTAFAADAVPTLANCSVTITSEGGGGGVSAYCTSVNSTTLNITVVSVTNGGSVPIRWSVGGVI